MSKMKITDVKFQNIHNIRLMNELMGFNGIMKFHNDEVAKHRDKIFPIERRAKACLEQAKKFPESNIKTAILKKALSDFEHLLEMSGEQAWIFEKRSEVKELLNDMDGAEIDRQKSLELQNQDIEPT